MATKTRTGSRASRTRATNPERPPATAPVDRVYAGKVTVARTRVDVPMLVAERSPVILPGANRANVHALSTVAASILSYCACGPTNLM